MAHQIPRFSGSAPVPFEPDTDTCQMVQDFIADTSKTMDFSTGEVFHECRLCGEVDSHADDCPIPAVEKWLEGDE